MIGAMKRIQLVQYTSTKDNNGRWQESVQATYNVWAAVVKTGGERKVEHGKVDFDDTYRFNVYFREGFLTSGSWRVIYDGKVITVTRIDRIDERRFNWQISGKG